MTGMISRVFLPLALPIANGLAQTPQAADVVIRSSAREVRSIGARRFDIVRQFLTESVLISVGGGLLGIAFGFFLAWLIARTAEWKTVVTTSSVVVAFGVSVAVGIIFGIYPAVKASRINPIDVLRYD